VPKVRARNDRATVHPVPLTQDPPPPPRARRNWRQLGYRTPSVPVGPVRFPRAVGAPRPHPLARREDEGRLVDVEARERRRAEKAAQRRVNPRPTRREVLAQVRAMAPDQFVGRSDAALARFYEDRMRAWQRRSERL
jgi:hypothetical protein